MDVLPEANMMQGIKGLICVITIMVTDNLVRAISSTVCYLPKSQHVLCFISIMNNLKNNKVSYGKIVRRTQKSI